MRLALWSVKTTPWGLALWSVKTTPLGLISLGFTPWNAEPIPPGPDQPDCQMLRPDPHDNIDSDKPNKPNNRGIPNIQSLTPEALKIRI